MQLRETFTFLFGSGASKGLIDKEMEQIDPLTLDRAFTDLEMSAHHLWRRMSLPSKDHQEEMDNVTIMATNSGHRNYYGSITVSIMEGIIYI